MYGAVLKVSKDYEQSQKWYDAYHEGEKFE